MGPNEPGAVAHLKSQNTVHQIETVRTIWSLESCDMEYWPVEVQDAFNQRRIELMAAGQLGQDDPEANEIICHLRKMQNNARRKLAKQGGAAVLRRVR